MIAILFSREEKKIFDVPWIIQMTRCVQYNYNFSVFDYVGKIRLNSHHCSILGYFSRQAIYFERKRVYNSFQQRKTNKNRSK